MRTQDHHSTLDLSTMGFVGVRRVLGLGVLLGLVAGAAACGDDAFLDPEKPNCPGGSGTGANGTGGTGGGGDGGTGGTGNGSTGGSPIDDPTDGSEFAGDQDNTFDHMNDPGEMGSKDPFEVLAERAEEGPPEVRTRLHSCQKIPYASLGNFLSSRGVNLGATSGQGQLPTAGELYAAGADALGVARFDAREGESYFHTAAGATKLFDIFVQAAPEVIANIPNAPACQIGGTGFPMFDPNDGSCVYESLSCVMGRPATEEDLILCNLMVSQADGSAGDIQRKRNITVAAFLAAAHTCE
jgi:hypothetical protein